MRFTESFVTFSRQPCIHCIWNFRRSLRTGADLSQGTMFSPVASAISAMLFGSAASDQTRTFRRISCPERTRAISSFFIPRE